MLCCAVLAAVLERSWLLVSAGRLRSSERSRGRTGGEVFNFKIKNGLGEEYALYHTLISL